jgi:hypothetical protein
MQYIQQNIKAILLGLIVAVGISYAAAADFTGPECAPPGCNTDAPLNVGTRNQAKQAGLALSTTTAGITESMFILGTEGVVFVADGIINTNGAQINGGLILNDGSQRQGRVLVSDANGFATWKDPATVVDNTTIPVHGAVLLTNPVTTPSSVPGASYSGTFVVPEGVTKVKATLQGAGGGSGYGYGSGGAGGYCVRYYNVTPGQVINYTIGTAGAAHTGSDAPSIPGRNGGNTTFLTTSYIAYGGVGGQAYGDSTLPTNGNFGGCSYGLKSDLLGISPVEFNNLGYGGTWYSGGVPNGIRTPAKNGYILVEY